MTQSEGGWVVAALVLSGVLLLSACSGDDGTPAPAPAVPESPALPGGSPSAGAAPSPVPTGVRTAEALAAQVSFAAPALTDPVQVEAVAAYEDYATAFVVAGGLPDGDYPPIVNTVEPTFREQALDSLRQVVARNEVILGSYSERVVEVAGTVNEVFIGTCIDFSQRQIYDRTSGRADRFATPASAAVIATMIKPGDTWLLSNFVPSEDVTCA